MKYSLGLDIGTTTVGWAVLNLDNNRIEDLGVRAFNAAEEPKTKASLAEPRRLARSIRRRLHRRAGRLRRAKDLFIYHGLIPDEERESAFETTQETLSPWQLRADGLDRFLTGHEFARALFHIIKRRGFKSNRKNVEADKESKVVGPAVAANRRLLEKYRTAGEMLCCDKQFKDRKRNTSDWYENSVDRIMLEEEIRALFARQREIGSIHAGQEFQDALLEVFLWQKPYASGDDILKKIGPCTFEQGENRAPKHSYHAERFTLLQRVNSLTYSTNGDRIRLDDRQRQQIEQLAYAKPKVTYAQARTALEFPEEARFSGLDYMRKPKEGQTDQDPFECEKATCVQVPAYHSLRKACGGVWDQVKDNPDLMDELGYALTFYKTDEDIRGHLEECGVAPDVVEAALHCGQFSKVLHLSLVALKKIIPHLERGFLYSEACEAAGYDHSKPSTSDKLEKLPLIPPDVTNNPVVRRALSQARRVVNAVIARYGAPYRIHIELAREIGKSPEDRMKIQRSQEDNRRDRERLEEEMREHFGRDPSGTDVLKYRLYREQNGQCAYSLQGIDLNRLFEPGYAEVDHIIPYSRCFDDGRRNQALVLASENQKKRNRTPFELFGHDERRWAEFEAWVRATIRDHNKRNNLLRRAVNEQEWKERSLTDTKYIAREFAHFLRHNLKFADPEMKQHVVCVNGRITARTRWLWGLEKHREENDLHHAMDAAVVATLLPHQIEMLTAHAQVEETGKSYVDETTGEIIERTKDTRPRLPQPWKGFRKELPARLLENPTEAVRQLGITSYEGITDLHPVTVSRMRQAKTSGAIHAETIRSAKLLGSERVSAIRTILTDLTRADLDNLIAPETNERFYAEVRRRMEEHGYDAKKAFAEPLHKPTNDGSPGPVVKSVKVCKAQYTGIKVRGGIADNASMVRTDVFRKAGKYYLVPVYVSDVMAGKLPNRAIAAGKPEQEWPIVDESYEFQFSLYPFDMVRMIVGDQDIFGYYRGSHRNKGALKMCPCNDARQEAVKDYGARLAKAIEKYEISVLGEYRRSGKEVRRGLANGSDLEPGEAED